MFCFFISWWEESILRKKEHSFKRIIILIYGLAFLFSVYKMFFYVQYVGRFPDEVAQISYIAYLEKENTIIPDFKDMMVLEQKETVNIKSNTADNSKNVLNEYTFSDTINYLGHPPLYYQIMRLSRAVQVEGNIVTVNLFKLRCFNIGLSSLAMLLILFIGYTRIDKNPILHWLYATIVVSVPMLAYTSAGVNNDTLSLLGLSVFILGLLRFSERKRNLSTYLLISLGVFIAFMSKLTVGLIIFISIFLFLIFIIIKEKNAWFLCSKKFLVTLPIYLTIVAYYLFVYLKTGSIQPSFRLLDPKSFYESGFYVAVSDRTHMNFIQYAIYFARSFLMSWTGIESGVSLVKTGGIFSLNSIGLLSLLFFPIMLVFQIKRVIHGSETVLVIISIYFGLAISAVIQFLRSFNEYVNISGYLGGFQSRYYLCGISVIALAITFIMKSLYERVSVTNQTAKGRFSLRYYQIIKSISSKKIILSSICILFTSLLFYEDFIYFLIYFKDYL